MVRSVRIESEAEREDDEAIVAHAFHQSQDYARLV